jgi:hypothetical protein
MSADLQFVEIPGLAEAVRRESEIRRRAYLYPRDTIAGVSVRKMTLRDMIVLEEIRNGFFVPFRFETDNEILGHSAQLVWWLSDCRKPEMASDRPSLRANIAKALLMRHLSKNQRALVDGVKEYLDETFMDAPKGSGGQPAQSYAASPCYVFDALAAGGYGMTQDEVLDMPLVRLWQIVRLVQRRVFEQPLTNPSDRLATDFLAKLNAKTEGKN